MGISAVSSRMNAPYTGSPGRSVVKSGQGSDKPIAGSPALSEKDQHQVEELKKRDIEVRAHEAAHVAAGGQYVRGGASFTYQSGPDGKRYAVGGEVSIDVSPVSGDPEATAAKMRVVKRAAMAPANPSGADQSVAAAAAAAELKAQQEVMEKKRASGPEAPLPKDQIATTEKQTKDNKSTLLIFSKAASNAYLHNSLFQVHKDGTVSAGPAIDFST